MTCPKIDIGLEFLNESMKTMVQQNIFNTLIYHKFIMQTHRFENLFFASFSFKDLHASFRLLYRVYTLATTKTINCLNCTSSGCNRCGSLANCRTSLQTSKLPLSSISFVSCYFLLSKQEWVALFTLKMLTHIHWDPSLVLHQLSSLTASWLPVLSLHISWLQSVVSSPCLPSLSAGAGLFAAFFFLLIIVSDVTPHGTVKAPGISLYIYVNKIMVLVAMAISTVVIWIHQYNDNNQVIFCFTNLDFI